MYGDRCVLVFCGDHLAIYTNTESLCCTSKTDICQLLLSKKNKKERKSFSRYVNATSPLNFSLLNFKLNM